MRLWLYPFLFLFSSLCFAEGIQLNSESYRALQLMNNGQLLEACSSLQAIREKDPERVIDTFLLALTKWKMMLLSDSDEAQREKMQLLLEEVEEKTLPRTSEDNDALFLFASVIGIRAQIAATENEWWTTAQLGKRMKRHAERLIEKNPEYYEAYYLTGSFNYFADVLPSHLKFLRSLLFLPGGDRKEGLKQLIVAYQKGNVVSEEAGKTLALIYTYYEKRHDYGTEMCDNLLSRYPENYETGLLKGINLYFESEFEKSAARLDQLRQALIAYSRRHSSGHSGEQQIVPVYFGLDREARYWLARNLIQMGHDDEAHSILLALTAPEIHQPYWLMRGVFLSLAQLDYRAGNPEKAEVWISKVLRWQDVKDSHDKAKFLRKKMDSIDSFEIDFL